MLIRRHVLLDGDSNNGLSYGLREGDERSQITMRKPGATDDEASAMDKDKDRKFGLEFIDGSCW